MIVTWKEPEVTLSDDITESYSETYEPPPLVTHEGKVIATHRRVTGSWVFLIYCSDGQFREKDPTKVKVVEA